VLLEDNFSPFLKSQQINREALALLAESSMMFARAVTMLDLSAGLQLKDYTMALQKPL